MKISVVTVVFNNVEFIEQCILSVAAQDYLSIEYVVVDGGSTDGTVSVINKHLKHISYFCSEKDRGLYDALNKGIALTTGEVVGVLHADDYFPDAGILTEVAACFKKHQCEGVYGNVNFIQRRWPSELRRKWVSKAYQRKDLRYGWMPAHPSLFLKRALFCSLGGYSLDYGTCADYELILRYFYRNRIEAVFLNKVLVNMRLGGLSNGSFRKISRAAVYDYKALAAHKIPYPFFVLLLKKLRKVRQFF
ncbi:glycosyltransferase family 2 protein [Pedobacter caeni]|uniref:Glycosyltransferase involved in cell wall bisynthesis n=1 Tax=Pedobacter caeni TaxID=288992 RepID=A0A1M4ZGJ4_9SPHI|nr:glycosyltransferase family 2 protein [Pedobacter caeni]SHF17078.1 Glycosyltransferase involved in cell wall bisynthesis [Pedobacter caeni]